MAALNKGSPSVEPHLSLSGIFFFFSFKCLEFAVQEAMIFIDISTYRIQHKLLVYISNHFTIYHFAYRFLPFVAIIFSFFNICNRFDAFFDF